MEKREKKELSLKEDEKALVVRNGRMESSEVNKELERVSFSRRMVRNMSIQTYSPCMFQNHELEHFYAGLENATDLERRHNPQENLLNPDDGALQENAGMHAEDLKTLVAGRILVERHWHDSTEHIFHE